jgi:hypothetical protein
MPLYKALAVPGMCCNATRRRNELYEIHPLAETTRAPSIVHSMSAGLLFQTAEEREMA